MESGRIACTYILDVLNKKIFVTWGHDVICPLHVIMSQLFRYPSNTGVYNSIIFIIMYLQQNLFRSFCTFTSGLPRIGGLLPSRMVGI